MLTLYHWEPNGPYLKPLIALYEKGLAFESRYVDPRDAAGLPPLDPEARLALEGEGPLLVADGRQLSESFFMTLYLDEAFAGMPLRPADALSHVRILALARFVNELFMPGANTLGCARWLAPAVTADDRAAIASRLAGLPMRMLADGWRRAIENDYPDDLLAESRRKVKLGVDRFERMLGEANWLVGESYSLADIDAFAICNALPELTPDLVNVDATPHLCGWIDRIRTRPAVIAALATSRTGTPTQAFVPGPEHARWG